MRVHRCVLIAVAVLIAVSLHAGPDEEDIEVNPTGNQLQTTVRIEHGGCPAYRWTTQGPMGEIWENFYNGAYRICDGSVELQKVSYLSEAGNLIVFSQVGDDTDPRVELRVDGKRIGNHFTERCGLYKGETGCTGSCTGAGFPGELWGKVVMISQLPNGTSDTTLKLITFKNDCSP